MKRPTGSSGRARPGGQTASRAPHKPPVSNRRVSRPGRCAPWPVRRWFERNAAHLQLSLARSQRILRVLKTPRATSPAFTLVEIMVVVVIIGLLAAIALPAFRIVRERSLASRLANDFRQSAAAFQTYTLEYGTWPAADRKSTRLNSSH